MEKKNTIISLIFVGVIVISAIAWIVISGITARELNYVQLEVNPRIEILCDKKFKVTSVRALNEDGEIILSNVNYIGMKIDDVAKEFLDECARCGYIDINGSDNAVNITIIDGITQALDTHIVKSINSYLLENEILCAIVETNEDRSMSNDKKENNVCCSNKYKLIETMLEYIDSADFESLNKLSEVELIDMVANIHKDTNKKATEEARIKKEKLLDENKDKYTRHQKAISNSTQREFAEIFDEYKKFKTNSYVTNFRQKYSFWQENLD